MRTSRLTRSIRIGAVLTDLRFRLAGVRTFNIITSLHTPRPFSGFAPFAPDPSQSDALWVAVRFSAQAARGNSVASRRDLPHPKRSSRGLSPRSGVYRDCAELAVISDD